MKKAYPFLLVSLFISSGNCFADADEEFIDLCIEGFKKLTKTEQIERIANARFVEGYIESVPDLASAFEKLPEEKRQPKKRDLYDLAHKLRPEIMDHCWERLDATYQQFLAEFGRQPGTDRKEVTFRYHANGTLEVSMLPEEKRQLLESMVEEQREPFYVYATLLQMGDSTERQAEKMEPSHAPLPSAHVHHGRLSRFLHKFVAAKA